MPEGKKIVIPNAALVTIGVGLACVIFKNRSKIIQSLKYAYDFRNPLRHKHIEVIETTDDCQRIVSTLKKHCNEYRVLGFDCEWVTVGGKRRPTAMLQLATHKGLCALIRLCSLKTIPISLRELLEDDKVIKVGIGAHDDAGKLSFDYGVGVASTFDLRYLAALTNNKSEGLAKMSKSILNVPLDKNWRLVCSDWEASKLSTSQIEYAAKDAMVAIEIFKNLSNVLKKRRFWQGYNNNLECVLQEIDAFLDVRFKESFSKQSALVGNSPGSKKLAQIGLKKPLSRGISTRSKTLYDNCLLEAPDGELLCTCDRKKAQWYVDQNLAQQVNTDPYTVRLNFEPAGRAVGEVGRYYQTPKENQCVVCGRKDAYIRKNIVPREYRKHFPVVMKSHTSHDVLLLCPQCHQKSNISDLKVRTQLAKHCNAPYLNDEGGPKVSEIPELKQLRSAARALMYNGERIPQWRKEELEKIVLKNYPEVDKVSTAMLEECLSIDVVESIDGYTPHGLKVVQEYQEKFGGLIELEKLWREHFLNVMKPKYLPNLWNVNHNANRLEIRANEGRIEKDDMLIAGLDPSTLVEVTK
ncbi:exonuclease 3'-5' domain-containing protein 2 isoform X2 [Eupeodes corollae]|uniref:exonuclease 3'-5' domain-containing protein 2 isoform X2 n=1 Tax=Eupeodes corollae TaxID=290404 RepID=UPI0024907643|nr:exonuclease 3'-5' domain-containing protein 2 isoform X2 [Eupeodes corollae]